MQAVLAVRCCFAGPQEAVTVSTSSLPPGVGILQRHASTPSAEACAGSSAPPAQAERSSPSYPMQHCVQHQHHQQQHPAALDAPEAQADAVVAVTHCSAAACIDAPAPCDPCSLTLYMRLQGCRCEQGLAALWDLARIFSLTEGAAAAADAGQMSAHELLQFTTDPDQLGAFREQLGQVQQGEEYRSTTVYLHGLQQLLAHPVVAAVLGWDRDHQQQRLAEVCSLCRMCQTAAAGQQQQQTPSAAVFSAHRAAGHPLATENLEASALKAPGPNSPARVAIAAGNVPHCAGSGSSGAAAAPAAAGAAASTLGCGVAARQPAAPEAAAQLREAAAAAPAAAFAQAVQLPAGNPSTLTVDDVSTLGHHLRPALLKWVQACGIFQDTGSKRVADLLPHYPSLLTHLDSQHSTQLVSAGTVYSYLLALCRFLRDHQQALKSSSVDYAAMLNIMDAACSKYRHLKVNQQVLNSLGGRKSKASAAVAPQPAQGGRSCNNAAAAAAATAAAGPAALTGLAVSVMPGFAPTAAAAAAAAAAGSVDGSTSSQLSQQLSGVTKPQAAEAATPQAPATTTARVPGGGSSSPGTLAAAASVLLFLQQQEQIPLSSHAATIMPPAADTAAATTAAAAPTATWLELCTTEQLPPSNPSTLTVNDAAAARKNLRYALKSWVQACGIAGDPGSVRVAELLPRYATLLTFLDRQYSMQLLSAERIYHFLLSLCDLISGHHQVLRSSNVDYAVLLSSMGTARGKYCHMAKVKRQLSSSPGGTKPKAAASANAAAAPQSPQECRPRMSAGQHGAAAGLGAPLGMARSAVPGFASAPAIAAAAAAAGPEEGAGFAQMLGPETWPQATVAVGPAAAAIAGSDAASLTAAGIATAGAACAAGGSSSGDGALSAATGAGAAVGWEVSNVLEPFQARASSSGTSADDQGPVSSGNEQAAAAVATAAAAAGQAATFEQPLFSWGPVCTPSTLTVSEASAAGPHTRSALHKWVQACGITGDPGRVRLAELLPHYAKLLNHLDSLHRSKQLIPQTVCKYLSAICGFLKSLQWALQWSSVDYAAMLSCMGAARTKYSRRTGDQPGQWPAVVLLLQLSTAGTGRLPPPPQQQQPQPNSCRLAPPAPSLSTMYHQQGSLYGLL